jgi:hypothetical protein
VVLVVLVVLELQQVNHLRQQLTLLLLVAAVRQILLVLPQLFIL